MRNTGLALALVSGVIAAGGAEAQDRSGGQRVTGSISQSFEADSNFDLDLVSPGTRYLSSTALSLRYLTETRTESFSLSGSSSLELADNPDGTSDTEFSLPGIALNYARMGANADFSFGASYRERDVAFLRTFELEFDDEGNIVIPDDLESFTGTGTRTDYGANFSLTLNKDAPAEFVISGKASAVDYSADTTNLNDTERYSLSSRVNLRFSPVLTGNVNVVGSHYSADDAEQTERDRVTLSTGLSYAVNPRLSYNGSVGYYVEDETVSGITTRNEGVTADLGVDYVLDETRLNASVGIETTDDDTVFVARMTYGRALPTGTLNAGLSRSVSIGDEGEDVVVTAARVSYSHPINSQSSANVGLSYSLREDLDDAAVSDDERYTFNLGYNRSLTRRVNMGVGYTYRYRDTGAGSRDSHAVTLTFSTPFEF